MNHKDLKKKLPFYLLLQLLETLSSWSILHVEVRGKKVVTTGKVAEWLLWQEREGWATRVAGRRFWMWWLFWRWGGERIGLRR